MRTSDELSTGGLGHTQRQTRSDLPQTDPLGQAAVRIGVHLIFDVGAAAAVDRLQ